MKKKRTSTSGLFNRRVTGVGVNDTLPSNNQRMGETNLNSFFGGFSATGGAADTRNSVSRI
jgi:hypothetical protein